MSVRAVHSKAGQRRSRSPKASLAVLVRAAPPLASRSLQWRFGLKPQLLLRRGPPLATATLWRDQPSTTAGEIISFAARRVLLLVILHTMELPAMKGVFQ